MTTAVDVAAPTHVLGAAILPSEIDHLSWSGVSCFSQCSKKFEFRYLLKAVPAFVPSALAFGQAVHQSIEEVQAMRLQGAPVPELAHLLDVYDNAWKSNVSTVSAVQFSKDENESTLRALADRMLSAYRQHIIDSEDDGAVIIGIEHAARFKLHPDLPDIEARIDLIELHGTDLVLTDYKTSRGKWNDAKAVENLPQLVMYAYAAKPFLRELGATRIVPRFVVISKLKTTTIQTIEPRANQADADHLKAQIREVYRAIQTGVFVPRTGWHCGQCQFKSQCPAFS